MPKAGYEVTDIYCAAYALLHGATWLRAVCNEKGWLRWIFEANQMRELFEERHNPQHIINIRQYLANMHYLRGQVHTTS